MYIKELAHVEDASVNLQTLGLKNKFHGKAPSKSAYPPRFNPEARKIWDNLMVSKEFRSMLRTQGTMESQWRLAIAEFMKQARAKGIVAIQNSSGEERNKRIVSYLTQGRIRLVAALDKTELLTFVKIMKPRRTITKRRSGFTINSCVDLKAITTSSYGEIISRLGDNKFKKALGGGLQLQVIPGLNINLSNHPSLSYTFEVHQNPLIPIRGNTIVSDSKTLSFIEHKLWLPIVRANRFGTLKNPKSLF